jgi:mono/diheme cytochrome c family protein
MRVPVALKVGAFALVVMGSYTYYANSIPQIQSKPPAELSLEGGNVTTAQLVKAGEEIFHTKGTCEICHRIGQKGTRAPDLAGIGSRAAKTKPGMSARQYIIESLLQPGAYLVEGYPNIMPQVDKPPIALNRSEVWALTAFLESLGGTAEVKLDDIPKTAGRVGRRRRAGRDQAPGRPEGGRSRVLDEGRLHCVPQGGQDRRLAGRSRSLADREDPDARLHHEEDPGSRRLRDGGGLPQGRDASDVRPDPDGEGVYGPGLVPADAQVRA